MDAQVAQRLQISATCMDLLVTGRKPIGSLRFLTGFTQGSREQVLVSAGLQLNRVSRSERLLGLEASCSYKNLSAPTLQLGKQHAFLDEDLVLKSISEEIQPYLDGRSIYIVGMMGCGKTTVGKIMSQALGYSFHDIDTLVEQDVGTSVAEMFKLYGEKFFREKESEALHKVSLLNKLVVSTGGGAVVWPINWQYMQNGISVWLDVPLEAIARRIAAVGTDSRPLLHHESGDVYKKTFIRLCTLMEERGDAYANADVRVSLENIAAKTGQEDVCDISPTAIAIEALEQIGIILKEMDGNVVSGF